MQSELLPNWLQKRAELSPKRKALITEDKTWTFIELHEQAKKMAQKLTALGIKKDDHVALLVDNQPEFVFLLHGIEYVGAVAVLLNTRLSSYEIVWQIQDSNTKLVIYNTKHANKMANEGVSAKRMSIEEFLDVREESLTIEQEWQLDRLHTIIYTSGTTGTPKGVMLSYGNHWWNAVGSSLNLGMHTNDCWLCALPLFHVSGLSILLRSVIYGIPVVLLEKFSPSKVNEVIASQNVSIISVVSQMLINMLADLGEKKYPSSLRCVLLGGGPAPKPLLDTCVVKGIPVFQTYGMTETGSQIVTLSSEYMLEKVGSAGKPLFPAQLRIEKDNSILGPGMAGEIVVKGPSVTKGYWRNKHASNKSILNGWLYTGDIGYLDEDGFLYVLDRRSDLIISGGENIYPAEVESVLLAYPGIIEVGVAGVDDIKWGQVPVAFVKTADGKDVIVEELLSFCAERLAKYKVPSQVYFVDELPRNASNKLMRHKLKELL
ncbi:o-succinylbenzoate--CoA ligase [Bacillus sp. Marseille-P3661]|uniref:o-succinylbenzoate--CoA ligase n=1 Tax=Bacillus sp. Marseille-P3661 TaxID=1936234 RepID=UPI000C840214|nr:o-succinylbenzoate--CoA ligase [Bacillus sp. Marseille-P3661]